VRNSKTKTEQLQIDLKSLLSKNNYQPGDRLPVVNDIQDRFNVSKVVVQSAVKKLKQEGYLTSIDRQGLFMAKRPPCLKKIVIAIGSDSESVHHNIFTDTILRLLKNANYTWQDYDIEIIESLIDCEDESFDHLRRNFVKGSCAGIILILPTEELKHNINLNSVEVPMAAICPKNGFQIPSVLTDGNVFWQKSYELLLGQGCEKIAIMHRNSTLQRTKHFLEEEIGLHIENHYFLGASIDCELATINLISLMFHPQNNLRPDALIIGDDNLENAILKGLIQNNVIPQKDVKIISHCNWPHYNNSPFPITYYGFETIDILNKAIDMISFQQKNPGQVPDNIRVSPVMEHQLKYSNYIEKIK